MTINGKNTALETKKETNTLLEQKQSYIENKKSLEIKRSPKLPILDTKRNIFWKQVNTYLQEPDRRYYMEFADLFKGIFYAHKLLMDVYHYIKLKDPLQIFTA